LGETNGTHTVGRIPLVANQIFFMAW
jgi:hypothetical protein